MSDKHTHTQTQRWRERVRLTHIHTHRTKERQTDTHTQTYRHTRTQFYLFIVCLRAKFGFQFLIRKEIGDVDAANLYRKKSQKARVLSRSIRGLLDIFFNAKTRFRALIDQKKLKFR